MKILKKSFEFVVAALFTILGIVWMFTQVTHMYNTLFGWW